MKLRIDLVLFLHQLKNLINTVRLRWLGEELGFEKLSLKNERLRAYFVTNNDNYFNSDIFGKIIIFRSKTSTPMQNERQRRKSNACYRRI